MKIIHFPKNDFKNSEPIIVYESVKFEKIGHKKYEEFSSSDTVIRSIRKVEEKPSLNEVG